MSALCLHTEKNNNQQTTHIWIYVAGVREHNGLCIYLCLPHVQSYESARYDAMLSVSICRLYLFNFIRKNNMRWTYLFRCSIFLGRFENEILWYSDTDASNRTNVGRPTTHEIDFIIRRTNWRVHCPPYVILPLPYYPFVQGITRLFLIPMLLQAHRQWLQMVQRKPKIVRINIKYVAITNQSYL